MLISSDKTYELQSKIESGEKDIFCSGLFLSAKWFVLSQIDYKGIHLIVLPDKETAEYCSSDLYSLVNENSVFFLPDIDSGIERSNYKSSLCVQRTSAIRSIMDYVSGDTVYIVTYPEALEELIPEKKKIKSS